MQNASAQDDLVASLGQLGFSQYEARAYCALLGRAPINGHEVAKASGVPPSKIYETLNRLVEKGAALVQRSEPVTYAASPPSDVLRTARLKFEQALQTAEQGLARIPETAETGQVWSLRQRDAVLAACGTRIAGAKRSLFAALWDDELQVLGPLLEAASQVGVDVHVAVYGTTILAGPRSYDLTLCGRSAMDRLKGRRLSAVVADEAAAVVAIFEGAAAVEAVVSNNPVVCLLTIEYIKADVLGRLLIDDAGEDSFRRLRSESDLVARLLSS